MRVQLSEIDFFETYALKGSTAGNKKSHCIANKIFPIFQQKIKFLQYLAITTL